MPFDHLGNWYDLPTTITPSQLHSLPPADVDIESLYRYGGSVNLPGTPTPAELLRIWHASIGRRRNAVDWTNCDPNGVWRRPPERGDRDRRVVAVPVCGADRCRDGEVVVEFRSLRRGGGGGGSEGPRVVDMLSRNGEDLERQMDSVLQGIGQRKIEFLVSWPGYEPELMMLRISEKDGKSVTRLDLALQISQAYAEFFRKIESRGLRSSEIGCFNITRPGSFGVRIEQVHLVRFRNSSRGVWVAELEIA